MKKLTALTVTSAVLLFVLAVGDLQANRHTVPTNVPPAGQEASEQGMERACEAIESSLQTRTDNVVLMAETILEKFDNISERVQEYYTTKLVPEGHEVENYDELLANIETQREAVNASLEDAQAGAEGFDCDLTNPGSSLMTFVDDMRVVHDSLQEYRLEIKELIVAVNTVVATEQGAL